MTSIIKNPRRIFTNGSSDSGVDSRVTTLENNEYKILYFATISTATGTITKPTNSTILLDQFYEGGDAIVETLVNGQPSGQSPLTAGGAVVSVSSFDASGNYTLSGTPSSFDVALVYILKIKAIDYSNLTIDNIMSMEGIDSSTSFISLKGLNFSPADASNYYFVDAEAPNTNATIFRFYCPSDLIIKKAYIYFFVSTTTASTENSSIYIRVDNTTDTLVSNVVQPSATSTVVSNTALDLNISAGSYFNMKWTTPTWATNPTNMQINVVLEVANG